MTVGLIPAHAGKTRPRRRARSTSTAHPRSRGENGIPSLMVGKCKGSSPLTRGKLEHGHIDGLYPGLIPAHAGKTQQAIKVLLRARAHPRSRGENGANDFLRSIVQGSSPLTRGKPVRPHGCRGFERLIPAHAGKTLSGIFSLFSDWAHPRSRGENRLLECTRIASAGSSPLTRGKHSYSCEGLLAPGLIPAHAGKTPWGGGRG